MLEEAISEGDRALIFTQFAEWGKLLQPYLEKQLGGKRCSCMAQRKNNNERRWLTVSKTTLKAHDSTSVSESGWHRS
jgi:SNF2 family DNA or RNA helicase